MSIESVVSVVIQRIGVLLYEEIKFVTDVEGEVNNLSMELKAMQSYLRDAEARQENFDQVDRIKVREIIKIAYDAEDVIESFILNCEYRSMRKESHLWKYFCFCCSLVHIHQIGKEVVAIQKRIQVTTTMFERYGVRKLNLPDNTIGTSSTSMIFRPRAYPHSDIDEHGKEVDFLEVLSVDNTTSTQGAIVRESRRLAMHEGLQLTTQNSHLRSFVYWTRLRNFDPRPVCENFSFLRVMHIDQDIESELPEALGDLIFLRYLRVNSAKVPRSLGNLHSRITIKAAYLRKSAYSMANFSEIIEGKRSRTTKPPTKVSGPISHSHNLSALYLGGSLRQLPVDYGVLPRNLTKLILENSKLSQDPMPFLGNNLPYLKHLILGKNAYTGSEMVCKENSFLALEQLQLYGLFNLRSLKVENGALPQLKFLGVHGGVQIPQRLKSLRN
ncbi:hypothetical protein Ancab_025476 [Ancistrocladus abbreviatus]